MLLLALSYGAMLFPGLFFSSRAVFRRLFTNWSDANVVCVSERSVCSDINFILACKLFISGKLVSAVHASLATAAGVTVVMSCKDVMTDSHWLVNSFVVFGAPYLTFDIYAMYLIHFHTRKVRSHISGNHSLQTIKAFLHKDWLLVLHHVVLLSIFMPVTLFFRRGLGDFFIGCFFTTEFSTPFISIGKILIQLGLDDTRWHQLNGVVVLLSFFTCRILIFPFMYCMYGRQFGIPLHKVALHLPLHCNLGNAVILAPQIYWFILLLKKANRLYLRQEKSKDE